MPVIIDNFELHLGPQQQGAPDSLLDPIIGFIGAAKSRQNLMIAVQEIDNTEIAEAIIAARQRGAEISFLKREAYPISARRSQRHNYTRPSQGLHRP